jgi:hypothetical protein
MLYTDEELEAEVARRMRLGPIPRAHAIEAAKRQLEIDAAAKPKSETRNSKLEVPEPNEEPRTKNQEPAPKKSKAKS